jgi:8-oxo-(d)GTP phosphatase
LKHKRLILVRHAHRDKDQGREVDNGISPKGEKQVKRLTRYFVRRFPATQALILSSPKVRCLETLAPLAALCGTKVQEDPLLIEQGLKESQGSLETRVRRFASAWRQSEAEFTLACSHGDWIPLCLEELVGLTTELKKGGWAEIVLIDGTPRLYQLIQNFKALGRVLTLAECSL